MRSSFDHEKLDVYQLELLFLSWLVPLLTKIKQGKADLRPTEIIDHLDRGSLSALLNTAEGNGRRQRQTRARFFDDARGSVTECAACLDALVARRTCTKEEIDEGKQMLLRMASMLTKLVERFDSASSSLLPRAEPNEDKGREEEKD